MTGDRELRVVEDAEAVAEEAARLFAAESPGTLLLTGGASPRRLYERLAQLPYDWEDVEVFFTDERCVPDVDPRSNFRMALRTFLSRVPARRHPMDGEGCDADSYEALLRGRFPDGPRFDFAVHGLGPDGHTASLFPGKPAVDVRDRLVVHVPEAGWEPFVSRISLTLPALSAAAVGVMLVTGAEKREPLRRLMAGEDIPAAKLSADHLVVLADREAAAGLG